MSKNKLWSTSDSGKKLWKRSFFLLLVIIILLAGGITGYICYFRNIRKLPPPPDISYVIPHLRHGDVILRSGVGLWSKLFRDFCPSDQRFSHVGIVCVEPDGGIKVLHSEGDDISGEGYVHLVSLEKFVNDSDAVGITRLKNIDPDLFVRNAQSYSGRPFDWKFNTADDSAVYCTELVNLALKKCDPGLSMKIHRDIIPVDSCLDPEIFTEIPLVPVK